MSKLKAILILFVVVNLLSAQDLNYEIQKVKEEITRIKKENARVDLDIRRADSLAMEEARAAEASAQIRSKDLQRRQGEIQSLMTKFKELQNQVNGEKQAGRKLEMSQAELKAQEKRWLSLLGEQVQALEKIVQVSLPWERAERLERVRALNREIAMGSTGLSEGLTRLNGLYRDEIRFGDEVQHAQKPLTRKNGEIINAQILRLGNQALVYSDEEYKIYGLLIRSEKSADGWEWREDLSFNEKNQIRLALDVKTGKKAPQLVSLPLGVNLVSKENAQ